MMLILFAVLLLFGGEKMPQLAKGIGKAIREFKKATSDVEQEIKRALDDVPDVQVPDLAGHVRKVVNEITAAADPSPKPKPLPPAAATPAASPAAPAVVSPESLAASPDTTPSPPSPTEPPAAPPASTP
jgi:sec-independent protein translocase protein TatA